MHTHDAMYMYGYVASTILLNISHILILLIIYELLTTDTYDRFYLHGLTLIPAWISNYTHYNVWDEMTYPFLNFKDATVEVSEWINNFISHFTGYVITYPCC